LSKLSKIVQTIAELLVVGVCTLMLAITVLGFVVSLVRRDAVGTRDFVEYWAAGSLLAHHANPYDSGAIVRLERSVGFDLPAQIMANPPWALPLVLPLGFLSSRAGYWLWMLSSIACLVASVRIVWAMHGRPATQWNILGYTFAPALLCLLAGQVTVYVLFGLVLFLRWHRSHPFIAGVSLWLCLLKPHLFLPFGVVVLAWIILNKSYKVLAGTVVVLGVSMAITLVLDPQVWAHYFGMMNTARLDQANVPCLSVLLRQKLWPHTLWLQWLPAALGCIWALAYFWRHRHTWDWLKEGSVLTLVSLLVPPYTWILDQAVLIPALLHGAYATQSRSLIALLALSSAAIEMGLFRPTSVLQSFFFVWTVPAWLAWYLIAVRRGDRTNAGRLTENA
jgi:Glycosyltransferase family 87